MSKRLIEANDLLELHFVGDPQVSPEKDRIAYVLTKMDLEKNGYVSSVFVSDLEGQNRQLTFCSLIERIVKDFAPK